MKTQKVSKKAEKSNITKNREPHPRFFHPEIMVTTGEVFITASGRITDPFPKVEVRTSRSSTLSDRRRDKWLISEAKKEAEFRGNRLAYLIFNGEDLTKPLPQASIQHACQYLAENDSWEK